MLMKQCHLKEIQNIKVANINYIYYDEKQKSTFMMMCDDQHYQFALTCKQVLEQLCIRYGSTLKGRLDFFSTALQIHKKVPVLVSERYEIILFPLYGFRNKEAMWISYNQIKRIYNKENITTLISFRNNVMLDVNLNYRSIYAQMRRCKRMINLLSHL